MSTHTHTPLRRNSAPKGHSWAASGALGATAWRVTLSCSVAVPILTRIAIYLTRIAIYRDAHDDLTVTEPRLDTSASDSAN